mmetsp:Transcript_83775/g.234742  ORF Transcript_83775/g.234742 Transcript_83775/m.234742 type:complete len:208 (+) Transcript_83775:630-1253(+)
MSLPTPRTRQHNQRRRNPTPSAGAPRTDSCTEFGPYASEVEGHIATSTLGSPPATFAASCSRVFAKGSFHVSTCFAISTVVTAVPKPKGIRPKYQFSQSSLPKPRSSFKSGAMVSETMDMSLIRMLSAGPDVSLKGSPTVSPTTQALPCSVFLILSFSHNFLLLSHAPPAFDIMIASIAPETIAPASTPMRQRGPNVKPMRSGAKMA